MLPREYRFNDGIRHMRNELSTILKPDRLTDIVDIGANPIDGPAPYKEMLKAGLCNVIGFEPQLDALSRLNSIATQEEIYLPYVVADGKQATLYICNAQGMTSILNPDPQKLALFNLFPEFGTVVEEKEVDTVRLDDLKEISNMDFLKIDVQGSELTIFKNGVHRLGDAVAVQTEVSFIPQYEDEPTFGQVDVFLRELGFVPHCFVSIKRWALAPTVFSGNPKNPGNQLKQADIIYVKDFSNLAVLNSEKLKHLALLSHHIFQSPDLVNVVLMGLESRGEIEQNSMQRYLSSLTDT